MQNERIVSSIYDLANKVCREDLGIEDIEKEVEYDPDDLVYFLILNRLQEKSRDKSIPFSMRAVPSHGKKWGMPYNFDYIFKKK